METQAISGFKVAPQQKRLWHLHKKNGYTFCSQSSVLIEGNLQPEILRTAIGQVVNYHDILKTNFYCPPGVKTPVMVIEDKTLFNWEYLNLSAFYEEDISNKVQELFSEARQKSQNLSQQSRLRLYLIKLSDTQHILIISLPALCADTRTIKNLVNQISQAYAQCSQGKAFSKEYVQYVQFSEWQNQLLEDEDASSAEEYWQQQKISSLSALKLPLERQVKNEEFATDNYKLVISQELLDKINNFAQKYDKTPDVILLACWKILVWRLTTESEIVIGTASERREYEELYDALGLLATWLPIKTKFTPNLNFLEVLTVVSQTLENAAEWQDYFVPETTEEDKIIAFPVGFEFENIYKNNYENTEISFSLQEIHSFIEPFKIKLTCLKSNSSLVTEFYYDINYFDKEIVQRLAQNYQTLLVNVINNPEIVISQLEILSTSERQQLLIEFNQTQSDYQREKLIHQLFEEQVEKTPNQIAVVFENEELTYAQLNFKANQLAHYLGKLGVKPEVVVGICVERSPKFIISLLAVLKAGGAYLPLDFTLPQEALQFRLQDAQASVLIKDLGQGDSNFNITQICLDTDWELISQESRQNPINNVKTENLVYVIYTSGSTGKPKGVAVEHQNLLNYLYGILPKLQLRANASYATVSSLAADLGNTMLFPALCTGGCLHIIDQETASDPQAFSKYCQYHPIDYLKIVPSHLSALLSSSPETEFLPSKKLILGGEASNWQLIAKIQQRKPDSQIFNHYGPTETTVGVLTYPIKSETKDKSNTVPIGKPLANNQVYILDEQLQPVPIGVPGELYIAGMQVSRGYLNRPELNNQKFIPNPFKDQQSIDNNQTLYKTGDLVKYLSDGNIEFLGRIDRQVKIRGFRIELGEIESKLQQHPGIQSVVVIADEGSLDNKRLIAYVVTDPQFRLLHQHQDTAIASELRSFCINQFPEYMIPSAFVVLKALPLTANGKIDYQALPIPEQTRPELKQLYVAPRSLLEQQLAEIWTEVLGLEKIGIHDNFFELGGHSLLITQLLVKVRTTFDVELPLKDLFNAPTIADLAEIIREIVEVDGKTERQEEEKIALDLHSEVILDSDIVPDHNYPNISTKPNSILLTGATGFLGTFLLNELLQQTSADIYCLVRAENETLAQERIENKLKSYLLWDDSIRKRIIPIVGDLSQPLLGLSRDRFNAIAKSVDVIYHNGAWVNFTYPYSQLKAANVSGTQEVLRLAVQSKVKPVHFISTRGVVGAADPQLEIIREDTPIDRCEQIGSGYTQSKWVAEKIVALARDRGIPISIYRPGRISGHSQTGVCNSEDHTYRMIRGCIQLGSAPLDNSLVNLIPVDYAVGAIVHLSSQPESLGKTFHLLNPQPTPWNEVANSIISLGYPVKQIDYQQWREQLLTAAETSPENPLFPLISTFAKRETVNSNTEEEINQQLEANNTYSALTGTSIVCPQIDKQIISIYLTSMVNKGLLDAPELSNSKIISNAQDF